MLLFTWLLLAYGFSQILVFGSIFSELREGIHKWGNNPLAPLQFVGKFLSGLIACMMCTSTWVGFFMSIVLGGLASRVLETNWFLSIFFDGMATCGMVWAINGIVEFFEESRIK